MTFREADKIMKYVYPACFYQEEDGRFSVEIPDLNLAFYGDDLPDAMYMASDAVAGRLLMLLKNNENLPKVSSQTEIKPDDETGFVSMIYTDLDTYKAEYNDEPFETTLTIPTWLNHAAKRKNINFSATFKDALITKLAQ
jgi:predicted RNase H-like HicB family nuclease